MLQGDTTEDQKMPEAITTETPINPEAITTENPKKPMKKWPFVVVALLLVMVLAGGGTAAYVINRNEQIRVEKARLAKIEKEKADAKAREEKRAKEAAELAERMQKEAEAIAQENAAGTAALTGEWKDTEARFSFVITGAEYKIPDGLTPPAKDLSRKFWVDARKQEFYYDLQEEDKGDPDYKDYYTFKYSLSEDGSELTISNVSTDAGTKDPYTCKKMSSDPDAKPRLF